MEGKRPEQRLASKRAERPTSPQVEVTNQSDGVSIHVKLKGVSADEVKVNMAGTTLDISAFPQPEILQADNPVDIIGSSPRFRHCLQQLDEAAATDLNVLICGETGTGKEVFARGIHQRSSRAAESFVAVDCTALPETIISSLLFGHEKGAFTGANSSRAGVLSEAHRGTLFLDEIGELSLTQQKAFLRVLQEQRFKPVGSYSDVKSDFRLIAATNRDLRSSVMQDTFREDLFYRIKTFAIDLPPLRDRSEDISTLAHFYVKRLCEKHRLSMKQLDTDFVRVLSCYEWPGNVRELVNTLEQATFMAQHEATLFAKHLPQHIRIQVARNALKNASIPRHDSLPSIKTGQVPNLQEFRCDIFTQAERDYLSNLVRRTGQNIAAACSLAGLSRSRLYSLLKKHQISFH